MGYILNSTKIGCLCFYFRNFFPFESRIAKPLAESIHDYPKSSTHSAPAHLSNKENSRQDGKRKVYITSG